MPRNSQGRPRLTPEALQARIRQYCDEYGVAPNADGLPPFPSGRRETRQHRDWIAVYKAHHRLARRRRGQCERCAAPVSDGSIFCDDHRASAGSHEIRSQDQPGDLVEAQAGRCPICGQKLRLQDAVVRARDSGAVVLHATCDRLVRLAEALGPEGWERVRGHLWPEPEGKDGRKR